MPTREQAEALIAQLGEMAGLPDLALDAGGACTLAVPEPGLALSILHEGGDGPLTLLVTLPDLEPGPDLLLGLLEANFLWQGTNGATFALEPVSGTVSLGRRLEEGADAPALAEAADALLTTAVAWRAELLAPPLPEIVTGEETTTPAPGADRFAGIRV